MKKNDTVVMTDNIDTKRIMTEGIFDSKKAWISMFALSLVMLVSGALTAAGGYTAGCVAFCVISFVLSVFGMFFCRRDSRVKLIITEGGIYRKTFFGRQTVIPLEVVCGAELTVLGTVSVYTLSGKLFCHMLSNAEDVFKTLKTILEERE